MSIHGCMGVAGRNAFNEKNLWHLGKWWILATKLTECARESRDDLFNVLALNTGEMCVMCRNIQL